jgi:hypothetical protein
VEVLEYRLHRLCSLLSVTAPAAAVLEPKLNFTFCFA